MQETDQLAYLAGRVAEHQAWAAKASSADIAAFHCRLADHYGERLADAHRITAQMVAQPMPKA